MTVPALFTCVLVVTAALDLHDIDEIPKVSLLQTRLQGNMKRSSGNAIPEPPSGHDFIMCAPHSRVDKKPELLHAPGGRTRIEAAFVGKGVWNRYNYWSWKIPGHVLLRTRDQYYNYMNRAPVAAKGEKVNVGQGAQFHGKVFYLILSPKSKVIVGTAATTMKANPGLPWHDVYASVPIGGKSNVIWAPGLSQVWVSLDKPRAAVIGFVGAAADSEAANIYMYPGGKVEEIIDAAMSFKFTSFSDARNPIIYNVHMGSDGFPKFLMSNYYHRTNCPTLQIPVQVVLDVKSWGNEIFWRIDEDGKKYGSYPKNQQQTQQVCLYRGDHKLQFMDTWGDGWHGGTIQILNMIGKRTVQPMHKNQWQNVNFIMMEDLDMQYGSFVLCLRNPYKSEKEWVDVWNFGGARSPISFMPWLRVADPGKIRMGQLVIKATLIIDLCHCYTNSVAKVDQCLLNGDTDFVKTVGGFAMRIFADKTKHVFTQKPAYLQGGSYHKCWP